MQQQLPFWLRYRNLPAILANLAVAATAYVIAFALRFDLSLPEHYVRIMLSLLPLLIGCKLVSFTATGIFRGWWRHVSLRDAEDIVRANVLGSTLFLATAVFTHSLVGFPRSVFILDFLVCAALQGGLRLGIPLLRARRERANVRSIQSLVLIVGAGSAGIRLLQEIEGRRELRLGVVGFVDDDPAKLGFRVCGATVLGTVDDLPRLVTKHDVSPANVLAIHLIGVAARPIRRMDDLWRFINRRTAVGSDVAARIVVIDPRPSSS